VAGDPIAQVKPLGGCPTVIDAISASWVVTSPVDRVAVPVTSSVNVRLTVTSPNAV
jgi:hypothetical protein